MNDSKIKVLLVEPEKYPKEIEIDDSLEAMQEVVGGDIEEYMPFDDDVQQKMQQMEIAKERARREAEAASDRMEEIVAELNRLQAEIKEIEAKRDKLQPLIDENQEVLAEKKAKMEGRMKIYRPLSQYNSSFLLFIF